MKKLTRDRAAKRFVQMNEIELGVQACDESIRKTMKEAEDVADRLRELRKTRSNLLQDMRDAAVDKGQLPLIDLIEKCA